MTNPHIQHAINRDMSVVQVLKKRPELKYADKLLNLPAPKWKPLSAELKRELYLIVCALGFLSVYAQENKKPSDHPVYPLINNLTRIVKLYKSRYDYMIKESFDIFDDVVGDSELTIDTICFSYTLLAFQDANKKNFAPNQKAVKAFWLEYKRHNDILDSGDSYKNSRFLAKEFFGRL